MAFKTIADPERLVGYKVVMYPTDEQKEEINHIINVYRGVCNLTIQFQNEAQENNEYISYYKMANKFSQLKKEKEYSWIDIPLSTVRQALLDIDRGYKRFFNHQCNHPRFKSKKKDKKSFGVRCDRCRIMGKYIRISGLKSGDGWVYASNHNIPEGKRLYVTGVEFDDYRYWFFCKVEMPMIDMSDIPKSDPIGIDVGIRKMITTSDGEIYQLPDTYKLEKRRKRQQKRLSRYQNALMKEAIHTRTKYEDLPRSKSMQKLMKQFRKTCNKITNKRDTAIHTATKRIVDKNPEAIVIENIKVGNILAKGKWMNKFIPQLIFNKIHTQIKYKAANRGIPVIIADREYPSSKTCSGCGYVYKSFASQETFICPCCGLRIDRDINAAINLRNLAYSN